MLRRLLLILALVGSAVAVSGCSVSVDTGGGDDQSSEASAEEVPALSEGQIQLIKEAGARLKSDYDTVFQITVKACNREAKATGEDYLDAYQACNDSEVDPAFEAADQSFEDALTSLTSSAGPDCAAAMQRAILKSDDIGIGIETRWFESNVVSVCRTEIVNP